LETSQRFFYGKADKLKSAKMIDALFLKGNSFSVFPFKVIWKPDNERAILQAGVGVSSRIFKKATDRNRIKRLMREAYRLQKNILHEHLVKNNRRLSVFILYTGKELPKYDVVFSKMQSIINRLIKSTNEKDQEPS
jgi:ribonuclease P protein component